MKYLFIIFALLTFPLIGHAQNKADEEAIKKLLEKESATWRSGDIAGHAQCWQVQPYSKILVSTVDGKFIDIPPQVIVQPPAGIAGKGGIAVNSDYKFSINGNNAWVSHNEVSTDTQGKKSYSFEIRILEKINGNWKIVAQSIHAYAPKN